MYVAVVYMVQEAMILMWANPLQGPLEGVGPEWHSPIGPKKYRFSGPNPLPLALVMDAARINNITHGAV